MIHLQLYIKYCYPAYTYSAIVLATLPFAFISTFDALLSDARTLLTR